VLANTISRKSGRDLRKSFCFGERLVSGHQQPALAWGRIWGESYHVAIGVPKGENHLTKKYMNREKWQKEVRRKRLEIIRIDLQKKEGLGYLRRQRNGRQSVMRRGTYRMWGNADRLTGQKERVQGGVKGKKQGERGPLKVNESGRGNG